MRESSSALYVGRVRHTRLRPFQHDFEYRVYYGLFDVDELDALGRQLRFFSVNRRNLHGIDLSDHGPADGTAWRPWVEDILADAGIDLDGGRVLLLTYPRVLGYVFDPISFWYCYQADGNLAAVLYEVRNTFGDRHVYVVLTERNGLAHSFDKALHVSPFNGMEQTYHFSITEPRERLAIGIAESDQDGVMFRAGLRLTRLPLSDRNLMRLFFSHPLLTLKVIGGIHWQALKLWLKGGTYHPRPEPPSNSITIVDPRSVTA